MPQNRWPKAELRGTRGSCMRVLLSTYGSRGDVEPMLGLAGQLRALGAQVRVCAPPNFAERVAEVGVELVPVGNSARTLATGQAADLFAGQFEAASAVTEAAAGCDALVATGMIPAAAGVRSAAEKLGIGYAYATFQQLMLPSPHQPPLLYPGRPYPPERADAQSINAMFSEALNTHRASIGLVPVDDVRDYVRDDVIGKRPWLATDPILDPWQATPDLDVVQTGAWILPDERALPADLEAFLDAGTPPVYVGFGSMPMGGSPDVAGVAIEAIRAHGRRSVVARGWADLTLTDDGDDCIRRRRGQPAGTVRQGGRRGAPWRRGHDDDGGHGRHTSSGSPPGRRPAVLGGTGGRAGHRCGAPRSDTDDRVAFGRARDGAIRRDERESTRRCRHGLRRRGEGRRETCT